jgi:3-dehydroquinate synthase
LNLLGQWAASGSLRHWQIIGGGVLCDLAAFAASLAGCTFDFYPTTLLAMVDASVGGKTGVNFGVYGKNQLGNFAFPQKVSLWMSFLSTLPKSHCQSGCVELLKSLLVDGVSDGDLEAFFQGVKKEAWTSLAIERAIAIKAVIIAEDPQDRARRLALNLGHTLGHALESLAKGRLNHGEAVAIGLKFAFKVSKDKGLLSREREAYLSRLLNESALCPAGARLQGWLPGFEELWKLMLCDKKASHLEGVRMVLLDDRGIAKNGIEYVWQVERQSCINGWRELGFS